VWFRFVWILVVVYWFALCVLVFVGGGVVLVFDLVGGCVYCSLVSLCVCCLGGELVV